MKYLQDYINEAQTKAFDDAGAFFAFSNDQLNKHKKEGITYVSLGMGLICPKENAAQLLNNLDAIAADGIKQDIEENGIENIIKRELGNHECYYTGEIDDAVDALEDYGITYDQVLNVYRGKKVS